MAALSVALAAIAIFAAVTATPRPVNVGDAPVYTSAARSVASGEGYRTDEELTGVPRYPPGLPVLLVPAALASNGDRPMQWTALAFGAALVFVIWRCAVAVAGHEAGAVAALFALASSAVIDSGTSVMADAPAAVATMGAIWATVRARDAGAGAAVAVAAAIRLNSAVFVAGLGRRRRAWLVAAPLLALLGAFQIATHGNLSGYRGVNFGLRYLTGGTVLELGSNPSAMPNWEYYSRLLVGDGGFVVPGLVVVAVVELWRRRRERHARFAAWVLAASLGMYLVYYFQSTRFLLPAFSVVIVYGATGTAALVAELARRRRRTPLPRASATVTT